MGKGEWREARCLPTGWMMARREWREGSYLPTGWMMTSKWWEGNSILPGSRQAQGEKLGVSEKGRGRK